MKIKLSAAISCIFASAALTPGTSNAQSDRAGELAQMCILNPDGTGQYKIDLDSLFVKVLTTSMPDRFSAVDDTEECDDGIDNNCDGEIDENCGEAPNIWDAGEDCDACMANACSDLSDDCEGDGECELAVACALEAKCLDRYLGPLSCLCGEDVTVTECQKVREPSGYAGACAQEFYVEQPPGWRPQPMVGKRLAGQTLVCMGLNCADACSENIYNYQQEQ